MLHAKIATDVATVITLPVLSALNCRANRKNMRAMTPAKHHSATSPLDVWSSGIAQTALISERYLGQSGGNSFVKQASQQLLIACLLLHMVDAGQLMGRFPLLPTSEFNSKATFSTSTTRPSKTFAPNC
jgi:hypothetical protein